MIVGGGIAGLAAAWRLRQAVPGAVLALVEADRRLGGKILTERRDGFLLEGGPDSFLSHKPAALALCRELGLEGRLAGPRPEARRAFVLRGGRLREIPAGLSGLVPARIGPFLRSGLLSPLGRARLALEPLLPRRAAPGDESLASFVRRRLGGEAYERLVEPLMAGIYAGDGERISLAATFPALRDLEIRHGSLLRGLAASRREAAPGAVGAAGSAPARPLPAFVTLAGGLGEMVDALRARLDGVERVEIRLGARAAALQAAGSGWALHLEDGVPLAADAVILAAPAYAAADLLAGLDADLAGLLRSIPHVSTAAVSLAYPGEALARPLDGSGYIVPRAEGRPVLACSWTSSKFEGRSPAGCALVRFFIGRAGQEEVLDGSDEDLVGLAREEARSVLAASGPPLFARVHRWPRGMPQYTLGHLERMERIERRLEALPGVFLAGGAYHGIGIPDCIASGESAATRAAEWLLSRGAGSEAALRADPAHPGAPPGSGNRADTLN